jgi:cytochrome c556
MDDFQKAAAKLSNSTGSLVEMKPAFLATAKTCKGCHDDYRKKKKK